MTGSEKDDLTEGIDFMKALIVDDCTVVRELLSSYVNKHGIEVRMAKDGHEALELLRAEKDFDFALVDWSMPCMDGLSFVKEVRSHRSNDSLALMMVTSYNLIGNIREALEEGANDFLMKPFSEEMLNDKLRLLGVL